MTVTTFLRDFISPEDQMTDSPSHQQVIARAQTGLLIHDSDQMTLSPDLSSVAMKGAALTITAPAANLDIFVAAGTSAAALQSVINNAVAGSVIRLAAGHFSFDRTVSIARDDITVTGAGSDQTIIDVKPTLGAEAFRIGQGATSGNYTLAADVKQGGTVLTLKGGHSFVAGDYMYFARDSTKDFFDSIGDTAWRNTDVALRTSIAQVAAVNGNVITLANGVHFDFVPGETKISEIAMAERVNVGGFSVNYGLTAADPSKFSNTMSNYDRNAVIEVVGTAGLHLFDITSRDVPSLGVNVAASLGANVDHITMTGSHNKGDGGNGYGLQIRDVYNSSFTNLTDQDMRHSVVFASWTSAAGNFVHVLQTDRDINFHGGRDHDNVVMVDASIRDKASDIIGTSVFINTEGTHYGTVTDPTTNITTFGHVIGSRLGDDLQGYDTGSWLVGMGGNDTLTGGAGNDLLTGGADKDMLFGGAGVDIATYDGLRANFLIANTADGLKVTEKLGVHASDVLQQVEWLAFDDGALRVSDMTFLASSALNDVFKGAGSYQAVNQQVLTGTDGADIFAVTVAGTAVRGLGGADIVNSTVSFALPNDVERLNLIGTAAIDGTGSNQSDKIYGNGSANLILGAGGNDLVYGKSGDDRLLGGDGADSLFGGAGNDIIDGGAGRDKLKGDAGADVFVFHAVADSAQGAADSIQDFATGVDTLDLRDIDANSALAGNQAFGFGQNGAASLWFAAGTLNGDVNGDGAADLAIVFGNHAVNAWDILL